VAAAGLAADQGPGPQGPFSERGPFSLRRRRLETIAIRYEGLTLLCMLGQAFFQPVPFV
jgi:hypothetical protein